MYSYDVKVRGTVPPIYLWGSPGILSNLHWPLLLSLKNDVVGDAIKIHTEDADGQQTVIGTLQAGECYTLPLLGLQAISQRGELFFDKQLEDVEAFSGLFAQV